MGKMDSIRMDNRQFIKGMWATRAEDLIGENGFFLDTAIPGTLEINEGRATLDLNGIFGAEQDIHREFKKIFGFSYSGLLIILEKCFVIDTVKTTPGYVVEKYLANKAFFFKSNLLPLSMDDCKALKATTIRFRADYFKKWFNIDFTKVDKTNYPEHFTVSYGNQYFETNKFDILEGKYSLRLKRDIIRKDSIENGFDLEFNPFISIETKDYRRESVQDLLQIANWVFKMNDFLTQSYGSYEYFEFHLEDEINRFESRKMKGGVTIPSAPFYSGRLVFQQLSDINSKFKNSRLPLRRIKDIYGDLIRAWFENWDKLKYIVDLYYQNRIRSLDIETKVVNKIKILETYYDHFWSEEESSRKEVDPDLENAIQKTEQWVKEQDFEDEVKKNLTKKINAKWEKRIYLTDKLKKILENLPEKLKNVFSEEDPNWLEDEKFIENYAKKLKNTRNYHTHGSNEAEIRLKTIEELSVASDILDAVIYFLILGTMGLEDEEILDLPFLKEKLSRIND